MDLNEAIKELKDETEHCYDHCEGCCSEVKNDICTCGDATILSALEQYRLIGTVEECREARERFMPKAPSIFGDGYDDEGNMIYDMYECPNCGKNYEIDYEKYDHCPACGQAIDWRDYDGGN